MKPTIGILAHQMLQKDGKFPGLERACANQEYIVAIEKSGGIPVVIPMLENDDLLEDLLKTLDAILLTGGNDVSPQFFNEEPKQKLGYITPDMDRFHFKAVELAEKHKKPILGICRGMQVLNVAFGGNLYQDLSYVNQELIKHWQDSKRNAKVHTINIEKECCLNGIYGEEIKVNSFHHQCIKELAPIFNAIAHANDGIIEAIECEQGNYKLGVQWHPESLTFDEEHRFKLFELFIHKLDAIKSKGEVTE